MLLLTPMPKAFFKLCRFALFALFCLAFTSHSHASDDPASLEGAPIVLDASTFMLCGATVRLWGVVALAADQQCWQEELAWSCGEQSTLAFKHFVENQTVICDIKENLGSGKLVGQCFRKKGQQSTDIARFLVRHGWAMDFPEQSDGYYAEDQERARAKRRGIWTSRFQTADDWRKGVHRYVNYPSESESPASAKALRRTSRPSREEINPAPTGSE